MPLTIPKPLPLHWRRIEQGTKHKNPLDETITDAITSGLAGDSDRHGAGFANPSRR